MMPYSVFPTESCPYFSTNMHYSHQERKYKSDVEVIRDLHGVVEKVTNAEYSTGSVHSVIITHINGPRSFFVRPAIFSGKMDFLQCRSGKLDERDARLGNIIVYYSDSRSLYVRGQIRFIKKDGDESRYDMFAIDYGWVDEGVPICQMFRPYFNIQVPSLIRHCKLGSWEGIGARGDSSFREMRILFDEEKKPVQLVVKVPDPFMLTVGLRVETAQPELDKVITMMDSESFNF